MTGNMLFDVVLGGGFVAVGLLVLLVVFNTLNELK